MRIILLLALTLSTFSFADTCKGKKGKDLKACQEAARKPDANPCQSDAEKHCGGFTNDGLTQCLADHRTELSMACAATLPEKK